MNDIVIAPLTPTHLRELRALESRFQQEPYSDQALSAELGDSSAFSFGILSNDRTLCAYLLCKLVVDELHTHRLLTVPTARRHGLARRLLIHALDCAAGSCATRALLEVDATNVPAIALYRTLGFSTDAIRKRYYASGADAVLMSRSLP